MVRRAFPITSTLHEETNMALYTNIGINLPDDIKTAIEKHPLYYYGNVHNFYVQIFRWFVNSDAYKITMLEARVRTLNRDLTTAKRAGEVWQDLSVMWCKRAREAEAKQAAVTATAKAAAETTVDHLMPQPVERKQEPTVH